ncbi:lipopolysaccharide heptosyltransferase RfaC [Pasteurella dagmatis]|uniref:Lipopolysaccharide heptosyltransferase 1 n=1 Tax=Pasteurella dagmatis ATCC 43325 TaxID=667128 RepID=C9PSA5_9PAST|nr:lipopolysaccharide heptosyltransferase RfaC [Pasteurella dagmatis]EEX49524.1 lipopolysaccharide heptosyltransferase I [Pasteurella dagmatis ATCC 43325]SNV83719.1 lipopolysaccharide heptosyltransferase 1 [Pasteurella dagmatis]
MKICLVKTSSMGDILHTLPALTDAQNAIPHLQVDWVVEENFAEIPHWHSAVNQVIPIALRRWRKSPFAADIRNQWKNYRTLLQADQYDAVIDAQGLFKSAFFATRLAQGTKHGYDRHSIREPIASFFYDRKYAISYQQHAVERIRQLFARSLNYTLPQTQGDYGIARHFPTQANETPYVIFFHGTTRQDKFLPDEQWRKLAEKLTALGLEIRLPWSNASERQRAEMIAQDLALVKILPKSNLSALAQQIVNAKAVVSVDTGLAHLTAALDKTNITLYGATDPKLIGAYGKNQHYLVAESMDKIQANEILQKLTALL